MAIKTLPDRELVCELLEYNPKTGAFHWRHRAAHHFDTLRRCEWWNGRYAGQPAGCDHAGYIIIRMRPSNFMAHRLAWLIVYGEPVPDIIDHIDYQRTNNRIRNLRVASHGQNLVNGPTRRNNTSGVKGVRESEGKFVATITHDGKRHHLGTFASLAEAAAARYAGARLLHGEFARHK